MPLDDISRAFKALGHPHRLAVIERLLQRSLACCASERPDDCSLDPTCCNFGDLAREMNVSQGTVSHHLKELERAGLIERMRKGRRVYVRANRQRIEQLRDFLNAQRRPTAALS